VDDLRIDALGRDLAMRGQYGEREFNGDTIYALQ
jgi:hypothetical protein